MSCLLSPAFVEESLNLLGSLQYSVCMTSNMVCNMSHVTRTTSNVKMLACAESQHRIFYSASRFSVWENRTSIVMFGIFQKINEMENEKKFVLSFALCYLTNFDFNRRNVSSSAFLFFFINERMNEWMRDKGKWRLRNIAM